MGKFQTPPHGAPQNQFYKWDVPTDWQEAFYKANGRKLNGRKL
jgi:hypothetical protein